MLKTELVRGRFHDNSHLAALFVDHSCENFARFGVDHLKRVFLFLRLRQLLNDLR